MSNQAYELGVNYASQKLGMSLANKALLPRLAVRAGAGAAAGGIASSLAGGEFIPGALYGGAGGAILGSLPGPRNRPTANLTNPKVEPRLERLHAYLEAHPNSGLRHSLAEKALNRDLTLGGIGGSGGGFLSRAINGRKEQETPVQTPGYPAMY